MILDSRKNLRFAVISQAVDFTMKKKKIEHTRTMRNFLEPDLQSPFGNHDVMGRTCQHKIIGELAPLLSV